MVGFVHCRYHNATTEREETTHQETIERIHALHEREESRSHQGVHAKGVGGNKSDIGENGEEECDVHEYTGQAWPGQCLLHVCTALLAQVF